MSTRMVIKTGVAARDSLIKGASFMADAVKSTLGPFGANAVLEKGMKVTNDGKTIAQEFMSTDETENLGINILRQAATRTDDKVGDGTTTAITLAQAILKAAIRHLPTEKRIIGDMTPMEVITQIEKERADVTEQLKTMSSPITTEKQLIDVATVSVEDKDLGKLIGSAQFKLGPNGVLIAEESNDEEHSVKHVNGVRIDNGFSTNMIAFDPATQSLNTPMTRTLLTDYVIQSLVPLAPVLKILTDQRVRDLAIIARGFSAEAIQEAIKYGQAGFRIYPINAPYTDQKEIMRDIAVVLGGRFIHTEAANIEDVMISDIGTAEKIVARRWNSEIAGVDDSTSRTRVKGRITELTKQLKASESDFEKRNLQIRIAQLTSGFEIVKIGGNVAKRKYLLDKAVDAVNSVRNAFQEGVVAGGGKALKEIADKMPADAILKPALSSVYEQIISTGPKDFEIPEWVKDPVKVLRVALEEACGVAATLSTTLISTAQEQRKPLDQMLGVQVSGSEE